MTLRRRHLLLINSLLIATVLTTAAVIAIPARQSILEQMEDDGRLLTEQFARAIAVGEEIGQELEALYAQQENAEVVLAPLVLTLAQASGRSVEDIAAQLIEASGYAAFEDFAERRMGDAWLRQFINHLLGDNVSAMWIVGPALETRLYDAVPDSPIAATLSAADRDALQAARDTRQTQTYHDGDFLRIAAPIVNSQGEVTGVVRPPRRTDAASAEPPIGTHDIDRRARPRRGIAGGDHPVPPGHRPSRSTHDGGGRRRVRRVRAWQSGRRDRADR